VWHAGLHGMAIQIRRSNMANSEENQEMKVVCEDDVCVLGTEVDSKTDSSSAWLDVFCPQYSCEFTSSTQLP
jgi:hypothetical protein